MKKQVYNPQTGKYEWIDFGPANKSKLYGDFHKDTVIGRSELERLATNTRRMDDKRIKNYMKAVVNRRKFKKFISRRDKYIRDELESL